MVKKISIMCIALMFSITNLVSKNVQQNYKALAAVVKQNSINIVNLINGEETIIDSDGEFRKPIINNTGQLLAYLNDEDLYIASITNKYSKPIRVTQNEQNVSYDWLNENILIYSSNQGGIKGFNLNTQNVDTFIESEAVYNDLKCDSNGNIYANKSFYYRQNVKGNSELFIENIGIIQYNVYSKQERVIVNAVKTDIEKNNYGLRPKILNISDDNRYIYIALCYNSSSTSADGVPFGAYDIKKDELIKFEDIKMLYQLYQSNPIAINPKDSSKVIVNLGSCRELHLNKTLAYIDIEKENLELLLPQEELSIIDTYSYNFETKGMVTMSPSFSKDGKIVYYSASETKTIDEGYEQWFKVSHPVYSMDLNSKNIKQITFPQNQFDFAPKYIEASDEVVFLRTNDISGMCSLWKIKNSKETMITDNIKSAIFDTDSIIDFFEK